MSNLICQKCGGAISNDFNNTLHFCTNCGTSLNLAAGEKTLSPPDSAAPQPDKAKISKLPLYLIGGTALLGVLILSAVGFFFYGLPKFTKQYHCTIEGKSEPQTSEDFVERARDHIEIYSEGGAASFDDCAIAALNEALRLNPDNVEALRLRGYGYTRRKQYEPALADYNKAIQIEPNNEINYIGRRVLYEDWDKIDLAIEDQTAILNFHLKNNPPNYEKIIEEYGERIGLYRKKLDFDGVIKDYTEIIGIKPDGFYFFQRAGAFMEKGDYENAIKDFTEAIRLEPDDVNNYRVRALTYDKMGKRDLAEADRRKSDELSWAKETKQTGDSKTVSGGVLNGKAVNLVKPSYPPAARAVRASGTVNVAVTIDETGNVISASAVNGHALLKAAAVSAAKALKFSPTLVGGKPVKVTGIVVYNFTP